MTPTLHDPSRLLFENQQRTVSQVRDAADGTTEEVTTGVETVILNPATGERLFTTTATVLRTIDGRIAAPQETLTCRKCKKGPWSSHAVAYCNRCQKVLCRSCAGNPAYCRWCRWRWYLKRFLVWVCKL